MPFSDSPEAASRRAFLPVVYLGTDATATLVARLRSVGIGVVVAESVPRGLRLLKEFRVAAVVFALPDLQGAARVAVSDTPVILLAAEAAEWDGAGITVVSRNTDFAVLGVIIRAASTGRSNQPVTSSGMSLPRSVEVDRGPDRRSMGRGSSLCDWEG